MTRGEVPPAAISENFFTGVLICQFPSHGELKAVRASRIASSDSLSHAGPGKTF